MQHEEEKIITALAVKTTNSQSAIQTIDAALQELQVSDLSIETRMVLADIASKERTKYADQLRSLGTIWKAI